MSYKTNIFDTVQYQKIPTERCGQRIDNYLFKLLKIPKSRVYNLLRKGEIRINKKRIKPHYRITEDDQLRIPPIQVNHSPLIPNKQSKALKAQSLALLDQILYEDDDLIILNKPAGLAVHAGSGIHCGVIEMLRIALPEREDLELVHRLDKETSGCLMVSKQTHILRFLHESLKNHRITKTYWALLKNICLPKQTIDLPLRKNSLMGGERLVCVDPIEGKRATTALKRLASFSQASLVALKPTTGRTHQLRVHTQAIQHPIAGDQKYGCADFNRTMQKQGLKRLFLHARSLRLNLPSRKKMLCVQAPLDQSLAALLETLKKGR